ncbi:ImmA/IrrE family metallo-endopeptidase [Cryobacterium sp. Hh7]|uniref:XRE family transcriptional regulator n=1 Tax=Cryobacterium sp. Hh7 TaxID=1259159 RepID=UPI001069BAEF|nr:XRE family transcriptional regulator [Cryobacterium sp. Hh7]TFD61207.1 ImmA/IrrE family metallo-endopeptidase [Cryobacterium sp. Hh7]
METLRERVLTCLEQMAPGTSQNELARRIGMAPSALSRALNETRGLTGDELVSLARELRMSVDWVLTGEDPFPIRIAARHNFSQINGYQLSRAAAGERAILDDVALVFRQAVDDLQPLARRAVPTDPSEAREMLLDAFGADWTLHFADAVERVFGIDVVKLAMPDAAGYSMQLPNATVIVVPTENFWGRQNWTIAHELGHISRAEYTPIDEPASISDESAANAFAAQLLLPEEEMRMIDWSATRGPELAKFLWGSGVSIGALGVRLDSLKIDRPEVTLRTGQLIRKYPPMDVGVFDDPISQRWVAAGRRRFPVRILVAHEKFETTRRSLAWMLGVEVDEASDEVEAQTNLDTMATAFGFVPAK